MNTKLIRTLSVAIMKDAASLKATRPTAVNLAWAVDRMMKVFENQPSADALQAEAAAIVRCGG
ncbi:MAG: hypothetical protein MZV63_31140 [Marinilabiliales bacterium]|nr:hypothetical protein [Marinilabiliales bacterium]